MILTAVALLSGSPASAALVLTNEAFAPVPPLAAGSGLHAVSAITIIPAGAMTFSRFHMLQMQTGLVNARWNIQVSVNGIPSAQQSVSGTTAFVNGYLLSYPTTSDVSFTVTLDGAVPPGTNTNVTILQVAELDNAGLPVPGSSITIIAPLVAPTAGSAAGPQVTGTPSSEPVSSANQQPAHIPGFSAGTGIGGLVMGVLSGAWLWRQSRA